MSKETTFIIPSTPQMVYDYKQALEERKHKLSFNDFLKELILTGKYQDYFNKSSKTLSQQEREDIIEDELKYNLKDLFLKYNTLTSSSKSMLTAALDSGFITKKEFKRSFIFGEQKTIKYYHQGKELEFGEDSKYLSIQSFLEDNKRDIIEQYYNTHSSGEKLEELKTQIKAYSYHIVRNHMTDRNQLVNYLIEKDWQNLWVKLHGKYEFEAPADQIKFTLKERLSEEIIEYYFNNISAVTPDNIIIADLSGAHFIGKDLSNINIDGSILRGTEFVRCHLENASAKDTDLDFVVIDDCYTENFDIRGSDISNLRVNDSGKMIVNYSDLYFNRDIKINLFEYAVGTRSAIHRTASDTKIEKEESEAIEKLITSPYSGQFEVYKKTLTYAHVTKELKITISDIEEYKIRKQKYPDAITSFTAFIFKKFRNEIIEETENSILRRAIINPDIFHVQDQDLIYDPLYIKNSKDKIREKFSVTKADLEEYIEKGEAKSFAKFIYKKYQKKETEFYISLQNADLSGMNLDGLNLSQIDFSYSKFIGSSCKKTKFNSSCVQGCKFNQAILEEADLRDIQAVKADFSESDMTKIVATRGNFTCAKMEKVKANKALLNESDLRKIYAPHLNLTKGNLENSNLSYAVLRHANLKEVNARGLKCFKANLEKCQAQKIDLTGADITESNLNEGNFEQALMSNIKAQRTNLKQTILTAIQAAGGDFIAANFSGVVALKGNFKKAILEQIKAHNSNFESACLKDAKARAAQFKNAILEGVDADDIDLRDAILENAKATNSSFKRALMERIQAKQSDFTKSNLHMANLQFAELFEAVLNEANLELADLRDADLRKAMAIRTRFTGAAINANTKVAGMNITDAIDAEQIAKQKFFQEERFFAKAFRLAKEKLATIPKVLSSLLPLILMVGIGALIGAAAGATIIGALPILKAALLVGAVIGLFTGIAICVKTLKFTSPKDKPIDIFLKENVKTILKGIAITISCTLAGMAIGALAVTILPIKTAFIGTASLIGCTTATIAAFKLLDFSKLFNLLKSFFYDVARDEHNQKCASVAKDRDLVVAKLTSFERGVDNKISKINAINLNLNKSFEQINSNLEKLEDLKLKKQKTTNDFETITNTIKELNKLVETTKASFKELEEKNTKLIELTKTLSLDSKEIKEVKVMEAASHIMQEIINKKAKTKEQIEFLKKQQIILENLPKELKEYSGLSKSAERAHQIAHTEGKATRRLIKSSKSNSTRQV